MGRNATRLAALGLRRLEAAGLTKLGLPGLRDEMCKTCACQPNSVPNGCLQTQLDLMKAAVEGVRFCCHSPRDGRMCAGWAGMRAELVANPLPSEVVAALARHKFSPPDDDGSNAEANRRFCRPEENHE